MKEKHDQHLLDGLPLGSQDAARLVLEAVEEMPALRRAGQAGKDSLMQALRRIFRAGIVAVQEQEKSVSFACAAHESLARRAGRRPTTLRDLRYFIRRLLCSPGLAEKSLRSLDVADCRRALERSFAGSVHSFRKGRAVMHSIFAYGIRQGWCSVNPVASIEVPPIEEKEIVPLSIAECRRLVETAKMPQFRECLPALGLMLFAGVRPGEVARLHWGDVHCSEGILSIAARHSKTGGARRVELCPPLQRMLKRHQPKRCSEAQRLLCPERWGRQWRRLRESAGLSTRQRPWVPDVLRHTFASFHALTYRNLPALQLLLGHRDARLLLTRYLNLHPLRRRDIVPFWRLLE